MPRTDAAPASGKAVVLLSGGIDSATCLAHAIGQGFECQALSFDYGQRHKVELESARRVAKSLGVQNHTVMEINLRQWGGSALTSSSIDVPKTGLGHGIPVTYVPARNIIFLAFAVSMAEAIGAASVFIGVNSLDYSGYPDCRPEFIKAFSDCANIGTKSGDEGRRIEIATPLQHMTKAQIISHAAELGLDLSLTSSCYSPDSEGRACSLCDSCRIRSAGFAAAGVKDPTRYSA